MSDAPQSTPRPGQIWQENDKRFTRFVRVLQVAASGRRSVAIRTVCKFGNGSAADPHRWEFPSTSRPTWADRERFGAGYKLHEDVP